MEKSFLLYRLFVQMLMARYLSAPENFWDISTELLAIAL